MADDRFEQYFSEKIWEMIPAVYSHEDGLTENPGVLRALVEVIAKQAAVLRRSHDRIWEDQFIELCNDWAVPYIGDLVGTRMVSALNRRGRRVDVAKTIYYRRRKGTLAILEELISDITGWEGTVKESFRRLARARHLLDPLPTHFAGRFTKTLPGGFADLRRPHAAELTGSAFDEYHHTPDFRKPRGRDGRYGIHKLAFYLHRLRAFRVSSVMSTEITGTGGMGFTFDPSGRDIPLFMPRNRPHDPAVGVSNGERDWGKWRPSYEWELPAPMRCRLLGHEEYLIEEDDIIELLEDGVLTDSLADEVRLIHGIHYSNRHYLRQALSELPGSAVLLDNSIYLPILSFALIDNCGKSALYPDAVTVMESSGNKVAAEQIAAGNLAAMTGNASNVRAVIDPERGRLLFVGSAPSDVTVTYHYGFSAEIGAGTYNRRSLEGSVPDNQINGGGQIQAVSLPNNGVTQINDSAGYGPVENKNSVTSLTLQAANQERPYLRLENNWILNTGSNEDSKVVIDGIWLGGSVDVALILRGDYEQVILRHSTLDPGGEKSEDKTGNVVPTVSLVIEGNVEELIIDSCITGPISVADNGFVETITIIDTIVQSRDPATLAIDLPASDIHLKRVTLIGDISGQCLWSTDSLLVGSADIANTQCGCFRFSAASEGSRLPRPYEHYWIPKQYSLHTSTRFGHPGFMQLSEVAPVEITRGAENSSEMGAFSSLLNPVRFDSLKAKVEEYMPFGLLPIYIIET